MTKETPQALSMDYFPIVQALCRAALASSTPAIRKQVERLRDALKEGGEAKQAATIATILTNSEKAEDMAPSRLVRSRAPVPGESLTKNTPLPLDRETSTPLAQIVFPNDVSASGPLFDDRLSTAVRGLIDEWSHIEELEAVGVSPAKSCLIFGVPGTGKTRLAMWMAKQLDLPLVVARLDSLVSSFLGTSARNIGTLFSFANRYRCLLLLDEFDALAKLRDDPQEVGEIKRIVNTLLQNLDVRQEIGFTIGITNHPQLLDTAVWRRFEAQLEIPVPDLALRLDMARTFMVPTTVPDSYLKLLAWFTEGATGAELEVLVRNYKKSQAMRGELAGDVLEVFRQFATMNSGRLTKERRALLFGPEKALVEALHASKHPTFSTTELGELVGKDRTTVYRSLKSKKEG